MKRVGRGGGFTLVEIAIVLAVLGVLARALLTPLGERLEARRHETTRLRLDDVRRALVGHLITRGVLPCPSPGVEGGAGTGLLAGPVDLGGDTSSPAPCSRGHGGVPGVALGVAGPVDASGALLDAWGNPLRYAVSLASSDRAGNVALPDWTSDGEAARVGLRLLSADLSLCRVVSAGRCPRHALRADTIAFVVLSTGSDPEPRDIERENVDGDTVYALAPASVVAGHRFDDQLVWASRDELASWLLRAEWLP